MATTTLSAALPIASAVWFALGTYSTVLAADRWANWTGVQCAIGAATPDPGYKAAGWYVRTHVPGDAVVFTPHDARGLESACAAYYMGRHCLAGENLSRERCRRLFTMYAPRIDAAVVEPEFDEWFRNRHEWVKAAVVTRGGEVVLRVYARPNLGLPSLALPTEEYNGRFDRACGPRRIPSLLAAPTRLPRGSEIAAVVADVGSMTTCAEER